MTVTDVAGNSATAASPPVKIDKTPPIIAGSRNPAPNANGWNNTDVTATFVCTDALSGVDSCGPTPQVVTTEGAGQTRTATAVDEAGNTASATVGNINIDKTPPTLTVQASPNTLWPANHRLIPITVTPTIQDALSGPTGFTLLAITSSEPDNSRGDGSTVGDIQGASLGTPDTQVLLRAERAGPGSGRVYTLTYQGQDRAGNTATASATVTVPHDQRQR